MNAVIYHNPRCSKSRQTLQLLRDRGIEPEIVEYLKHPPGKAKLREILQLLGMNPRELMRTREPAYKEAGLDRGNPDDDQLLSAMTEYPVLMERPIVLANGKAALGRPPERVLDIL